MLISGKYLFFLIVHVFVVKRMVFFFEYLFTFMFLDKINFIWKNKRYTIILQVQTFESFITCYAYRLNIWLVRNKPFSVDVCCLGVGEFCH